MSKIALCHFRIGETDGVSLEMEKWKIILERNGHEVIFLSGNTAGGRPPRGRPPRGRPPQENVHVIPELHYKDERNLKIIKNAFYDLVDFQNESALEQEILEYAAIIQKKLEHFIQSYQIETLVPNNIFSLGHHLAASIAFTNVINKLNIPCIAHHHDFYWEREVYQSPTCRYIEECLETFFPPKNELVQHVLINGIAQAELKERRGCAGLIVPNVFDFDQAPWEYDSYNQDFREKIGVSSNDLLVLQATRIAERKTIELAIDFLAIFQQPEYINQLREKGLFDGRSFNESSKIKFVLVGLEECAPEYMKQLKEKAEQKGVDMTIVSHLIQTERKVREDSKIYSLWDSYVSADFITYTSILEGWGNQLLEAMFAKKPVLLYEYPVYHSDLADLGFEHISLGNHYTVEKDGLVEVNHDILEGAVQAFIPLLTNKEKRNRVIETNFEIAKKHFSYESLSQLILPLFK